MPTPLTGVFTNEPIRILPPSNLRAWLYIQLHEQEGEATLFALHFAIVLSQ